MKSRCLLSAVLISCLLFSGCAETPDEVQREIEILEQQKEDASSDGGGDNAANQLSYMTLPEIRTAMDAVLEHNQSIVQVIGTPVLPQTDHMPVYSATAFHASDSEVEKAFQITLSAIDSPSLMPQMDGAAWHDEETPITQYSVDVNGEIRQVDFTDRSWFVPSKGFKLIDAAYSASIATHSFGLSTNYWEDFADFPEFFSNSVISDIISVGYGETPKRESYPMYNGEEWKIADAIAYAEQLYADCTADASVDMEYRVKEVIIHAFENGNYGYSFTMQCVQDGVPVLPLSFPFYSDTETLNSVLFGSVSILECPFPQTPSFYSLDQSYVLSEKEEQRLLTPNSAIQILADALAQQQVHSVYMELGYVYQLCGSEYVQSLRAFNDCSTPIYNNDYTSFEAVPYWFFYEEFEGNRPNMSGTYYLVNALTGELEIR